MTVVHSPFPLAGRRALLLADGFSTFGSKTAVCYLRYRTSDVVAVVDRTQAGQRVGDVVGFGGDIPIVASVGEAAARRPEIAVVGVAPVGGQLVPALRGEILECARLGLDIASGLHSFLRNDAEIAEAARRSGSRIWDVRWVPEMDRVSDGSGCTTGARTVFVAGSDCNVGKMTATVQLHEEAERRGLNAAWAATGQTGMMLRERGISIDRVVADFVGGAAQELVDFEGSGRDLVFVEGQGSIVHPGYAGVALGLILGVVPDCMVLVHAAERSTIGDSGAAMPPLETLIALHESLLRPFKDAPVAAIALNTAGLDPRAARDIISRVGNETGLPTADPVRSGAGVILDAVLQCRGE